MKKCCFIGHRNVTASAELIKKIDFCIKELIEENGVRIFLFGSRSKFDTLCHERVTEMQKLYPDIRRIAFVCKSEYACLVGEKENLERIAREVSKQNVFLQEYEEIQKSEKVFNAGKASYVERNQEMINQSDYCVFFYNSAYFPQRKSLSVFPKKSGTKTAFDYAVRKQKNRKDLTIINLYEE